ncbi:MAG: zinc ribbon domain-containing protein [Lachnospiraceae bacterium]|nr:zinc ribbon domain-containing protein [Lachnospiraceae bacterium]
MVCKSCGAELEDGALFCGKCGTKVVIEEAKEVKEAAAQAVEEVKEATAEEAKEAATEAAEEVKEAAAEKAVEETKEEVKAEEAVAPVFAPAAEPVKAATPVAPVAQKEVGEKKNSGSFLKKFWFIIPIVCVVALVAIIIGINHKAIMNSIMKAGSSDRYFKWVAKNYVEESTEEAISLYNDYKAVYNLSDEKISGEASVEFGGDADKYLKLLKQMGYDYTWVENAGISYTVNSKDEVVDLTVGASFNGVELTKIEYLNDLKNEEEYISFPSVKSAYGEQESYDAEDILEYITEYTALSEAMPNSADIKKLIIKYMGTAIDQVGSGNVKVSDKTLRAGGITQDLTAVTLTIDNDLCQKIAISVVQQMQEDKELRKVVEQFISDIEDTEYADELDLDDFDYDEFLDDLSDLEEELEDEVFLEHYDWREGKYVEDEYEYVLYVNNKGEIVGCSVEYEGDDYFGEDIEYTNYKVKKGSNVAYKMDYDYLVITAVGKESGNKFTGEINIEYSNIDIATIEVTKYDVEGLEKGKLSGKFVVIPEDSLFRGSSMASRYEDMILIIDCDMSIKSGKLMMELDDDDNMLVKVDLSYNVSAGSKIKLPSGNNVIDMDDDDAGEELYESMDLDLLVQALEKAGAPDDVIEQVEDIDDYDDFLEFLEDLGM